MKKKMEHAMKAGLKFGIMEINANIKVRDAM